MRYFVALVILCTVIGGTIAQDDGTNNIPGTNQYNNDIDLTVLWENFETMLKTIWIEAFRLAEGVINRGGACAANNVDCAANNGGGAANNGESAANNVEEREDAEELWEDFQDDVQLQWDRFRVTLKENVDRINEGDVGGLSDAFYLLQNNLVQWSERLAPVIGLALRGDGNMTEVMAGMEGLWEQFGLDVQMGEWLWEKMLITVRRLNPCCGPSMELGARLVELEVSIDGLEGQIEDATQAMVRIPAVEPEDWTLVFRATAGNNQNVYSAWTTGSGVTTTKPTNMKRSNGNHFRDPLVGSWPGTRISRVKYSLFQNEAEVAYVIFNGVSSTRDDWFSAPRILESSWTGVTSTAMFNFFSVEGDTNNARRRFVINTKNGGCPEQAGYSVTIDTEAFGICDLDLHAVYPQFLYSQINGPELWDRPMYGRADFAAVYIEYTE